MREKVKRVFNEENESYLHFNKELLKNKVAVEVINLESHEGYQTVIDVLHLNDMDVVQHTLYWNNTLSAIEVYRIVSDIYTLFSKNTLADFLQLMNEMSEVSLSALMQPDEKNKLEIRERITSVFEKLEEIA